MSRKAKALPGIFPPYVRQRNDSQIVVIECFSAHLLFALSVWKDAHLWLSAGIKGFQTVWVRGRGAERVGAASGGSWRMRPGARQTVLGEEARSVQGAALDQPTAPLGPLAQGAACSFLQAAGCVPAAGDVRAVRAVLSSWRSLSHQSRGFPLQTGVWSPALMRPSHSGTWLSCICRQGETFNLLFYT